jgi:hypothetical protein
MSRQADVVFVIDTTGSMQPSIQAMQRTITQLADIYTEARIDTRLSLIQFRDRVLTNGGPEGPLPTLERAAFTENGFTTKSEEFRNVVEFYAAAGGGPTPESSMDALALAARSSWRDEAARIIIHITDAPPRVPDFEIRSMAELVTILSENHIDQLHMICKSADMPRYDDLVDIKSDGVGGSRFATVTWNELQNNVEDIIEDLRDIAKTSSDLVGFADSAPIRRDVDENPFLADDDKAPESTREESEENPFTLD